MTIEAVVHKARGRTYHLRVAGESASACGLEDRAARRSARPVLRPGEPIFRTVQTVGQYTEADTIEEDIVERPHIYHEPCVKALRKRGIIR